MKKLLYPGMLALFLVIGFLAACDKEDDAPLTVGKDQLIDGKSLQEWIIDWWQFLMSHDCASFPSAGAEIQAGSVHFLSGMVGTYELEIDVRADQYILSPVINYINDYPCPDPDYKPAPGQTLEEFLQQGAAQFVDLADDVSATLDGQSLAVGADQRLLTELFAFRGNPEIATCLDPCVTGELQDAVSDGYWIMLRPLSRGVHILELHCTHPWTDPLNATITINVN